MRVFVTAVAAGSLLLAGPAATAGAAAPAPSTPWARVAAVGALLGPRAAQDAYTLLHLRATSAAPTAGADAAPARPAAPSSGGPAPVPVTAAAAGVRGALTVGQLQAAQELAVAATHTGVVVTAVPAIPVGPAPMTAPVMAPGSASVGVPMGGLFCPVRGPVVFGDGFGADRPGGRLHQGTDLAAAAGTPLVAVAGAVVTALVPQDSPGDLGGISVSYTTATGDLWYNAHLSAIAPGVRVGGYLQAGQVFGYVGATGDATGPHLHIERHPAGGAAVDAGAALRLACG